jgi:hypothetical protein
LKEIAPDDTSVGERDDKGIPKSLNGFNRLPPGGALRFGQTLQNISIDAAPNTIKITKLGIAEAQEAKQLQPVWKYDPATDTLTNVQTNKVYRNERGNFVTGDGDTREVMQPGFPDFIGLDNVARVVTDPPVLDRHVEVDADEDALAFQIEIAHREEGHKCENLRRLECKDVMLLHPKIQTSSPP